MITYTTPPTGDEEPQPRTPGKWWISCHRSLNGERLIVACNAADPGCPSTVVLSKTVWTVDGDEYQIVTAEIVFGDGTLLMLYGVRVNWRERLNAALAAVDNVARRFAVE